MNEVEALKEAIRAIDPLRLAWVETQMQVSCQAREVMLRRSGRIGSERKAERELIAAEQHKETAAALRVLVAIVEGEDESI